MSGTGISWAVLKSAPRSRQITMQAPHHSVFYQPYAFPATRPTVSKLWRQNAVHSHNWQIELLVFAAAAVTVEKDLLCDNFGRGLQMYGA